MPRSEPRSFGPEWYHPITFSRARIRIFLNEREEEAEGEGTVDFLEHGVHFFDISVI